MVKTSDEDASFLYPDATPAEVARRWCALGASVVIVTHGADGAVLYVDGDEAARRPGQRIVLADTVGAGDSFSGGLLAALAERDVTTPDALRAAARGPAVAAALDQAILVSAMTCERAGANPPTRQELDERRGLGGSS